ncbi:hypothetical protein Glove_199g156 [Diversispora epigaea]|uniref:Uncharacterized protein n=1 Tax=Diversispora epigaea TaxID=1348612 RepID=A0A397IK04_9GLOM|nr:hypothetical protein Glove_199g156 [Diversispora epigaea]
MDFTTFKTNLQQCLPLIRYFHIPGTEVLDKVKPYRKILDKQLWEDLNQHFMAQKLVKSIILHSRTILVHVLGMIFIHMYSPYSFNFTLDNAYKCNNNNGHYEKPIRAITDDFSIVDCEVFKVIWKF